MKCPNCGQELEEGMKFCISCGANVEEVLKVLEESRIKEAEERKLAEEKLEEERRKLEEERQKIEEEKLRMIREEEARKREEEERQRREKEAEENAKKAIENIVEEKTLVKEENKEEKHEEIKKQEEKEKKEEKPSQSENEFKPAKKQVIEKPKKRRKSFLRRFFDRLILIIVLLAILIGGVYYLNVNGYLPEEISSQINGLIDQIKDVKSKMDKDYEKEDIDEEENKVNTEDPKDDDRWVIENKIEADNIVTLNAKVSAIVIGGKYGIIDNKTGDLLLDTKYDDIYNSLAGEILVKMEDGKYSTVDSKYQPTGKQSDIVYDVVAVDYVYNTEDRTAYVVEYDGTMKALEENSEGTNVVCRQATIKEDDIEEKNGSKVVDRDKIKFEDLYGVYSETRGEMITDCIYSEITNFNEDGIAAAKKEDTAGFLNSEGKEFEFNLEETRYVYNGTAWAKLDGNWGVIKVEE